MRRRKNKIIAGTVVAVMMAGSIMANISPLIASQTGANSVAASETFNKEGLWITEIYQNDVDRSEKNNTREKSGYESIKLYKSTTDLMEFVEITSTYDKAVNFNDTYEFVYDDTVQKVTTMDGNDEVIIQPEEKVVLWNYRSDVTTAIPTEEEFRREMRIPDDAVVLKVTSGVNWAVTSTFSLKTKSDDRIISTFKATVPAMMVDMLASIVVADMNEVDVGSRQSDWDKIAEENDFTELIKQAISDTLIVGDGAFKLSIDTNLSQYPIIEFYPGDRVEIIRERGRVKEVVFKTVYTVKNQEYILLETYGKGYITYMLTRDNKECDISTVPELAGLRPVTWEDKSFMMAIPLMFYKSAKFKGRGKSIYDSKIDEFDALDEAWSQWMDALRHNRTKEYIPENLLPRNPSDGAVMLPNSFDNAYIQYSSPMAEGASYKIEREQSEIPHEGYLATYITALDLCLQGIMSPSTLGIDVKKLDNAEAQREKEKATLYSRNNIVNQLQKVLPKLVKMTLQAIDTLNNSTTQDIDVDVTFGEYANPSFESQVETVSKAKQGGIMSVEASIDELYGDTKDDDWKQEEVARLKAEQGISDMEEPALNMESDGFEVDF